MLEIVIPLFKVSWITKAVLESLNLHYNPRKIHIISVKKEIEIIEKLDLDLPIECHNDVHLKCRDWKKHYISSEIKLTLPFIELMNSE